MTRLREPSPSRIPVALILFFASGFAGLVYEVLWVRELGLLFGNTAQAAAATLSAFFLGLVVGARFWGKRASGAQRPLHLYAVLELGVASSALLYFWLLDLYHQLYAPLFQSLGDQPVIFLVVKFLLALCILFPPSFFMGGTLPTMSQYLARRRELLGRVASHLYAVNTLGAALGAYLAGFHLPRLLGITHSYLIAISTTGAIALLAWILGERSSNPRASSKNGWLEPGEDVQATVSFSRNDVRALALFSGFATLGLEVLWTRMFAQVLRNSVLSFSTILVTFLLALALGAWAANWLIRRRYSPGNVLFFLLLAAALLVGTTPLAFYGLTDGLRPLAGASHIVFGYALVVLLAPTILLGTLFPYLMRLAQAYARSAGGAVGDLTAVNTVGAIAGSLLAGFVLLDFLGLWSSIRFIAVTYASMAFWIAGRVRAPSKALGAAPLAAILLLVSALDGSRLPIVHVDPLGKSERLLGTWEDSAGIVSVVRDPSSLTMRVDNTYAVGGTGAAVHEERQAHLPLLLHPRPRSVFFLGMGTGITAGAALKHPVGHVVVAELSSKIVEAARVFFQPYLNGLFEDPRVLVVAEDGRNYLAGTERTFDVIVADLFVPWKAGVGSLYSREHYETARKRLHEGGLYAQWLPLYQVSRDELGVIARTMTEVFPRVTLWRGIMAPGLETALLVGHRDPLPLELDVFARRMSESPEASLWEKGDGARGSGGPRELLVRYCGNLTAASALWEAHPVNTDDHPVIEYGYGGAGRHGKSSLVGERLLELLGELLKVSPPDRDPYLRRLSPEEHAVVRAGLSLQLARVLESSGNARDARTAMEVFSRLYAGSSHPIESEADQTRRELKELIDSYVKRLRALRERLEEVETSGR